MSTNEYVQQSVQKYPDGSSVHIDEQEWTVELICRDRDSLLPGQADRGEDYNLYRLSRHNTKRILRWQYEIDAQQHRGTLVPSIVPSETVKEQDEQAVLILQQVQEGYHTEVDVAEMKRHHESLYGITLDDPEYVGLCNALDILQQRAVK